VFNHVVKYRQGQLWELLTRFLDQAACILMNKNNLYRVFVVTAFCVAATLPLFPSYPARAFATQSASPGTAQSTPQASTPPPGRVSKSTLRLALPRREYLCAAGARVVILIETNEARLTLNSHIYNMKKVEADSGTKYAQGSVVWSSTGDDGFLADNTDPTHPKMLADECHLQSSYPAVASIAGSLKGTATFGQQPTLPADAVLIVQLRDLTHDADDPAAVLAEERVPLKGRKSPVSFALTYDPTKITAAVPFGVSASITGHDKLLFVLVKAATIPDLTNPGVLRLALSRVTSTKGQTPPVPEAPPHL
jgi:uncharacterized lipoprotein YbaY